MAKKTERDDRGTSSVSVRLPDKLIAQIDSRAKEEHRSRGNLIRMLLEETMEPKKVRR
jgi:metal-responsive CopG/Arc/MetJ family transcriptional regulator